MALSAEPLDIEKLSAFGLARSCAEALEILAAGVGGPGTGRRVLGGASARTVQYVVVGVLETMKMVLTARGDQLFAVILERDRTRRPLRLGLAASSCADLSSIARRWCGNRLLRRQRQQTSFAGTHASMKLELGTDAASRARLASGRRGHRERPVARLHKLCTK